MPATLEPPKIPDTIDELLAKLATPEAASPAVMDVSLFDTPQRTIQYLQYAGLLTGNEDVTALNVLKRVNHAAFADERDGAIQALQEKFQQALQSGDVNALTEGDAQSPIAQLVDGYLAARVAQSKKTIAELDSLPSSLDPYEFSRTRHRAEANAKKYETERAYYLGNPDILNSAARAHPEALKSYLPLGRLAIETGLIKGEKSVVADMVDDTLANAAAHSFMHIADEVMTTSDADLELNRQFPERYQANIIAKANDTAATTVAIDRANPPENTTPELARIQALNALLSAHLHAMTQDTSLAVLADNLPRIKPLVKEYQSAAMSLAYHFLGEGAGRNDARMRQLREHLVKMMEKNKIPLRMNRGDAEAAAASLAAESAAYLRGKSADNTPALTNIDALMQLANAPQQSLADRFTGPVTSYVVRAGRAVSSFARGE